MKPDNLDQALREWEITDTLPPRFGERVWQRIAREEADAPVNLWRQFSQWIGRAMARPSLAAGYVGLLLLAGVVAGTWQAQVQKTHTLEQLSSRYVQMLDPYQTRH